MDLQVCKRYPGNIRLLVHAWHDMPVPTHSPLGMFKLQCCDAPVTVSHASCSLCTELCGKHDLLEDSLRLRLFVGLFMSYITI